MDRMKETDVLRVLVVEDDPKTSEYLMKGLQQEGFAADLAWNGEEGFQAARASQYDVILMDIMLPGLDGLQTVQRLRQLKVETPVLVLSAKAALDDRIRGLRAGGDDYLTKPFAFAELIARIEALVRRVHRSEGAPTTVLNVGDLTLDFERHQLSVCGHEVELQPGELKLLGYLMRNTGRVVSKTMILDYVWGYGFDPQTNVVEAKISRLRTKLAAHTSQQLIHTVRGLGYKIEAPS